MSETSKPKAKIVLIGSYLVALVMDTPRIPLTGETLIAKNFREVFGGKGSDMAVQAARLGAPVKFVGCIGDDNFGGDFVKLMRTEGVDIDLLDVRGELKTGAGFIIKSAKGENVITIDIGANQLFQPAHIDRAAAHMLAGDIVLIQLEIPLETALYAAKIGHGRGATVILNPAPAYDLRAHDLTAIDILTPNETEARACLGLSPDDASPDEDIAQRLLQLGPRRVLMTQGERGSLIVSRDVTTSVPAFKFNAIVDSTGAGDAFNAALSTALLEGRSIADAARFANAVAGLCCTRIDTVPSYHTRQEVDAFLATQTRAT